MGGMAQLDWDRPQCVESTAHAPIHLVFWIKWLPWGRAFTVGTHCRALQLFFQLHLTFLHYQSLPWRPLPLAPIRLTMTFDTVATAFRPPCMMDRPWFTSVKRFGIPVVPDRPGPLLRLHGTVSVAVVSSPREGLRWPSMSGRDCCRLLPMSRPPASLARPTRPTSAPEVVRWSCRPTNQSRGWISAITTMWKAMATAFLPKSAWRFPWGPTSCRWVR